MAGLSHLRQRPRHAEFDDPKIADIGRPNLAKTYPVVRENSFAESIGALLDEMKTQMASEIARAEATARKERERADRLQDENDDLVAALAEATNSQRQATDELRTVRSVQKTLFAHQAV